MVSWEEDWTSSFTEAKNKEVIPLEGISHVMAEGKLVPITEAVSAGDFGPGRAESGVLVKLLDAGERLGIQVPLSQGYHIRIHKVRLSRPYIVREGGFCIGTTDDMRTFAEGCLTYRNAISKIEVVSNTATFYCLEQMHPGMHNLRPLAYYPSWATKTPVPAGEYLFITTVLFTDHKKSDEKPIVQTDGRIVTVAFNGELREVDLEKEYPL